MLSDFDKFMARKLLIILIFPNLSYFIGQHLQIILSILLYFSHISVIFSKSLTFVMIFGKVLDTSG